MLSRAALPVITPAAPDFVGQVFAHSCEDMGEIPSDSIHCVVTSPPYFSLRNYGTGRWIGGAAGCDHEKLAKIIEEMDTGVIYLGCPCGAVYEDHQIGLEQMLDCGLRGAYRLKQTDGQDDLVNDMIALGLGSIAFHSIPDRLRPFVSDAACGQCYVCRMVTVFREVRRVLRRDGVAWLNLGDSFAANRTSKIPIALQTNRINGDMPAVVPDGMKPKDVMGVPWLVAFALRQDGWYLRSDIVWNKANPMPESVTDRPTRSHEYVFLLAKSEQYFYDNEAIKEPLQESSISRILQPNFANQKGGSKDYGRTGENANRSMRKTIENFAAAVISGLADDNESQASLPFAGLETPPQKPKFKKVGKNSRMDNDRDPAHMSRKQDAIRKQTYVGFNDRYVPPATGRNKRSVWTVATKPYRDAHFATFPPELITPMIKAGTSEAGCCANCGSPWRRMVEVIGGEVERGRDEEGNERDVFDAETKTVGFEPSCVCDISGRSFRPGDFDMLPQARTVAEYQRYLDAASDAEIEALSLPTMTRFEQRSYAQQILDSEFEQQMADEAGEMIHAFRSLDGDAVPVDLLESWLSAGWIRRVSPPVREAYPTVPCIVMDPFMGSGTTAEVAESLGRRWTGFELNSDYHEMIKKRTAQRSLFA